MSNLDIKYEIIDREMIIKLPERVDNISPLEFEKELYHILNNGTNNKTSFDAENLESISLSGLRVIEKLRLEFGNMKLVNLKPEVDAFVRESGYTGLL